MKSSQIMLSSTFTPQKCSQISFNSHFWNLFAILSDKENMYHTISKWLFLWRPETQLQMYEAQVHGYPLNKEKNRSLEHSIIGSHMVWDMQLHNRSQRLWCQCDESAHRFWDCDAFTQLICCSFAVDPRDSNCQLWSMIPFSSFLLKSGSLSKSTIFP